MATDGPLPFGDLLRRLRLAAGLSQEALAERAGLSARGISDLERGARDHRLGRRRFASRSRTVRRSRRLTTGGALRVARTAHIDAPSAS